jgi:hypothetical protein
LGAGEGEDEYEESGGGDQFADQVSAAGAVLVREVLAGVEHGVGEQRPADAAGALRRGVCADVGEG